MSFGALAFLNPWLLAGLLSLPLIYLLLRTVPPRPKQVEFPPTRILAGLENREKTPAKTPWWLLLIRLLAAALVILALAEPVLNPTRERALTGSGPVVIVVDNGWAGASHWSERRNAAEAIIDTAQSQGRPVVVAASAVRGTPTLRIEAPVTARATLAALSPQPFAPDRAAVAAGLKTALANATGGTSIVWLTDGIDHAGTSATFVDGLVTLSRGGSFAVLSDGEGKEALGLAAMSGQGGRLEARIVRSNGGARSGQVHALSSRGERLGEASFSLAATEPATTVYFTLPLELRNQVTRVEIAGERSAGAVSLIDAQSQWHRVGLLSGEAQEQSQPLLAPLYYIEKALAPYAEIVHAKDANLAAGIDSALKQNATVLMLADIGTLSGDLAAQVEEWVSRGGVLVRFAGPRLEKGGDALLPVPLRLGGRTLGGSLSWSTPQPLTGFDDKSPFAGLAVPPDVTINRQVLADPQRLGADVGVWARLQDGTPLVTARRLGQGQIVLFHVTANSDWSNLPIAGVFVDMLRRLATLGRLSSPAQPQPTATASSPASTADPSLAATDVLPPRATLDGFGTLSAPPPTAEPLPAARIAEIEAGPKSPPGLYGPEGAARALNVLKATSSLAALPPLPAGVERIGYANETSRALKPSLLVAALALVFADILAVLLLSLGGFAALRRRAATGASAAAVALAFFAVMPPGDALAQRAAPTASAAADAIALQATSKVTFGYVLSGNAAADETSRQGLSGLSRVLAARTAVTPGDPLPVDILNDEIAFFPVLYWPVLEDADPLPAPTLARIDAYMKQGGMIVFDTRDYGSGRPSGSAIAGRDQPLQRILGQLDIPRLEPVPEGHVLTKSFYLLRSFPGRWDGGQMWVEAEGSGEAATGGRQARRADGVTSIVITSNDLAAAWALDDRGRPLYPVVPGGETQREMAFRTGVNLVMHALTGNYKADQVHVPALLERLGQ
ncbi:MAG: DUF4159 domain-containing protein [Hyphomicrobiaceae bacterium]|nr:DUF4159 domain-containing protein [Hyphomicrobiaceae bacterium]